jgi:predicted Fe-Mo cluster-binding NifX family protein
MSTASLAQNKRVIDYYQQALSDYKNAITDLKAAHAEITAVKEDTATKVDNILKAAQAEVTAVREDAAKKVAKIEALITKYEAALETTTQQIEKKHEARLKQLEAEHAEKEAAYVKKLDGTAELAEIHYQSAKKADGQINALLTKLGTSAKKVVKLTDAVSVSSDEKVGVGTTTPKAKLDVAGNLIRTIAHATGNGPNDQTDVGQIKSRVLSFSKAKTNTKIRISYTDNLRTNGSNKACRWEIRVDGGSCPNQALVYNYYTVNDNIHRSRTVVGYCSGVAAGSHTIGIWVDNTPGYSGSDCDTGAWNSTWVIEAEEVNN